MQYSDNSEYRSRKSMRKESLLDKFLNKMQQYFNGDGYYIADSSEMDSQEITTTPAVNENSSMRRQDYREVINELNQQVAELENQNQSLSTSSQAYEEQISDMQYRINDIYEKNSILAQLLDLPQNSMIENQDFYNIVSSKTNDIMIQIDAMEGHDFERYTGYILSNCGFKNIVITKGAGDQGIDVAAERHNVRFGFQCKNYKNSVGTKAIQEAYAGLAFYNLNVGVVITNSKVTEQARKLAEKTNISIWDRSYLIRLAEVVAVNEVLQDVRNNYVIQ